MTKLSKNGLRRMKVKRNRKKKKKRQKYICVLPFLFNQCNYTLNLSRCIPCPLCFTLSEQVIATSLSHDLPISYPACNPCTMWPQEISIQFTQTHWLSHPASAFFLVLLPWKQCFSVTQQLDLGDISLNLAVFIRTHNDIYTLKTNLL